MALAGESTVTATAHGLMDAAIWYAQHGLHVFPLHTVQDGVCSCANPDCKNPGKHPITPHGLLDATRDDAQIRRWWARDPLANVAIRTGPESGIVVIDIDPRHDGLTTWGGVLALHPDIPQTKEALTGGGGNHLFFRYPKDRRVASGSDVLGRGVDVRADGGYVVAPPSAHASGQSYAWEAGSLDLPSAELPEWLADALTIERQNGHEKVDVAATLEGVAEGQRDDALFKLASRFRWADLPIETANELILKAAASCVPPFPPGDALAKVASAYGRYAPTKIDDGGDRIEQLTWDTIRVTTVTPIGEVSVEFAEMERGNRTLDAEMTIRLLAHGTSAEPYSQRINMLSISARESCRRELDSVYGKDANWAAILSRCMAKAHTTFEAVDRAQAVGVISRPASIEYLVDRFAPANGPTILFGAGESAKTFIAVSIAVAVARGEDWLGRKCQMRNVFFMDYETGDSVFAYRVHRVLVGTGLSDTEADAVAATLGIYYWDAQGVPLADQMPAIRQAVSRHNCGFIVVDHAAAAAGARPEDADSALRVQRALKRLDLPALLIAHITGESERDPLHVLRPFGSIFWRNLAREMWFVNRIQSGSSRSEIGLYNRKTSDGMPGGDFGINVFFTEDGGPVQFAVADLRQNADLNAARGREWQVWEALDEPLPLADLAKLTGWRGQPDSLRKFMGKYPTMFEVDTQGGGRGNATIYRRRGAWESNPDKLGYPDSEIPGFSDG